MMIPLVSMYFYVLCVIVVLFCMSPLYDIGFLCSYGFLWFLLLPVVFNGLPVCVPDTTLKVF